MSTSRNWRNPIRAGSVYGQWIRRRERKLSRADTDRRVFPFEWGLEWLTTSPEETDTPLEAIKQISDWAVENSPEFFHVEPLTEGRVEGDSLTFRSPVSGFSGFSSTVYARLFPASNRQRAVVVVPQWNANSSSHVSLCRVLQRLGITALRLSMPFHEQRRPAGMIRADYMVSPNVGRTLAVTRQAVLEVRQAVNWLRQKGYRRIGVVGTSIGSCISYLSFVHDAEIDVGVFNHVSAYFADVVWTGISTRYVRWGLEEHIQLDDLRHCWAPISPASFIHRLNGDWRPHILITASHDLTFRPELSELVFQAYADHGIPYDRARLPCGHYTTAQFPFKYLDGWHICRYLHRHL